MALVIKPLGGNVAIGFFGGNRARDFEAACKDEAYDPQRPESRPCDGAAISEVKAALAKMYGVQSIGTELADKVYVTRWSLDPWMRGAYAVVAPGAVPMREVLAEPVRGNNAPDARYRLYFAGEACSRSIFSGSFPGAYESGLTAARKMIVDLGEEAATAKRSFAPLASTDDSDTKNAHPTMGLHVSAARRAARCADGQLGRRGARRRVSSQSAPAAHVS